MTLLTIPNDDGPLDDRLFRLSEVPKRFPLTNRTGELASLNSVYGWAANGIGRVVWKTEMHGVRRYTRPSWVREFMVATGIRTIEQNRSPERKIMTSYRRHLCVGDLPCEGGVQPWTECRENNDGELWLIGGPVQVQVSFCPYCGTTAQTAVEEGPAAGPR